jgi:ubiquinone/menaquinone biosynthesis C-methylase UbiE
MSEKTREILHKHHRDGEHFAQIMIEGFSNRFGEDFWSFWQQWMEPVQGNKPVLLDLGCGPGMFLNAIKAQYPTIRAYGIEVAEYMLDAMVSLSDGCEIIEADLHDPHLPFADASVDVVFASVVIHEMEQPVKALQEIYRCLKPGGRFFIIDWVRAPLETYLNAQTDPVTVFDGSMDNAALSDLFVHFIEHNRFSCDDLIYLLKQCHYKVIFSEVMREGRMAHLIAEKAE